jgi:hypothetical protein
MFSSIITNASKTFSLPDWMPHTNHGAPGIPYLNFGLFDFGPVLFFFLIGLIVVQSFNRRLEREGKSAYKQFFFKNAALVGIVAVTYVFFLNTFTGTHYYWNSIIAVGFTGMLLTGVLPFCRKNKWIKLAIGVGILLVYTLLGDKLDILRANEPAGLVEGGWGACFGYLAVVLISSFIGDMISKGTIFYFIISVVLGIVAVMMNFVAKADYSSYNTTYLLTALAILNGAYFIFYLIYKYVYPKPVPLLSTLGRNLLLFLVITGFVDLLVMFALGPFQSIEQLLVLSSICAVAYLLLAIPLSKKKVIFKM